MFSPNRIDLSIPRSWRMATTRELEIIARVMINESKNISTYHPFDITSVKIALFFLLSDIEVCAPVEPVLSIEDQYYLCRRSYSVDPWYRKLWRRLKGEAQEPFALYLSQIQQIIRDHLSWVDKTPDVLIFPYPIHKNRGVTFRAPSDLMQDFSWQRYRYASDYFAAYTNAQNLLLKQIRDKNTSALDLRKSKKHVENYRAMFLATLFTRKVRQVDTDTHLVVNEYAYASNQSVTNQKYFRSFSDTKFQVILFWWSGMTLYLQRTYPHCFKKTAVKGQKAQNPLELYTRTTATMEKYLGMTEREVNRQLYTVIFQHLEDMAKEAEEMERIRNK